MDKMLGCYTVKRTTSRWPLAFFFNMIDVASLAAYIIFSKNNPNTLPPASNLRRQRFLQNLAHELCYSSVELRSSMPNLNRYYFLQTAIECVLNRQNPVRRIPAPPQQDPRRTKRTRFNWTAQKKGSLPYMP